MTSQFNPFVRDRPSVFWVALTWPFQELGRKHLKMDYVIDGTIRSTIQD